ncbi:MAG TPA: 23S rRNA (guanosine(2251)-2'-O)-methyltransferase RlmB [Gammaproteobacteria bacterium]
MGGRGHIVYGLHAVEALLARRPSAVLGALLLDAEGSARLRAVEARLAALGVPVRRAPRAELDRRSGGGRHQGVVVEVGGRREFSIRDFEALVLERGRAVRLLVLDGVEDPRNLGACLRTADAAGVDAVVVPRARAAGLTPAAAKAAAGAAETVPLFEAPNLARALAWLKQAGVWVVGADAAAPRSLHAAELAPPIAVVLGGEGRGLRRLTRDLCDELVAIPMAGSVASLNVSVAAGVVLFELLRQAPLGRRGGEESHA